MNNGEKLCIILLKYIPVICAFIMMIHVLGLIWGSALFISELIVLTLVSFMIMFWSYVFKFCLIHRFASLYTITVLWCCYIQRYIGFGILLEPLRLVFFYLGVILFILIGFKYAKNYKKLVG